MTYDFLQRCLALFVRLFLFVHFIFFFLNDPATTEIYPLPLHDALPISAGFEPFDRAVASQNSRWIVPRIDVPERSYRAVEHAVEQSRVPVRQRGRVCLVIHRPKQDRKSTRLNSSHLGISYAVFCLEKKKVDRKITRLNSSHLGIWNAVLCFQIVYKLL